MVNSGKTRMNLRIPVSLYEFAKGYADGKNTTVTQLVIDHLTALRDREKSSAA